MMVLGFLLIAIGVATMPVGLVLVALGALTLTMDKSTKDDMEAGGLGDGCYTNLVMLGCVALLILIFGLIAAPAFTEEAIFRSIDSMEGTTEQVSEFGDAQRQERLNRTNQ